MDVLLVDIPKNGCQVHTGRYSITERYLKVSQLLDISIQHLLRVLLDRTPLMCNTWARTRLYICTNTWALSCTLLHTSYSDQHARKNNFACSVPSYLLTSCKRNLFQVVCDSMEFYVPRLMYTTTNNPMNPQTQTLSGRDNQKDAFAYTTEVTDNLSSPWLRSIFCCTYWVRQGGLGQ